MNRICIINPPYNVGQDIEEDVEHIGIAYIAGYLEKKGMEVDIYDCPYQGIGMDDIKVILRERKYSIVGICTYFYNYLSVKRIIREIKGTDPEVFVFLGGYLPTLSPERFLYDKKYFDCMILGEGELTTFELVKTLGENRVWKNIKGIAYFDQNALIINEPRELVYDLDTIPFPKRPDLNRSVYTVITSRGCYGHCNFCGIKEFYQKNVKYITRCRTPRNVISEITELTQKCQNISEVRFNDDNFALSSLKNKNWFEEFVELAIKQNINLKYTCLLRANDICLSKQSLIRFKEIGLRMVFIGIESFVQSDLDFYNKRVKVEENIKALQICDELGIRYQIGFMMFNPESTIDKILNNIECIEKIEYNKKYKYYNKPVSNSVVIVTEGAPLEKYVVNAGLRNTSVIGYKFRDEKVHRCFEIINEWYNYIEPINNLSRLEEKFEKANRTEELSKVRELFYDLYFYDLHVLKRIALEILSAENVDDYYCDLTKEIIYVKTIYSKLKEIENGLE